MDERDYDLMRKRMVTTQLEYRDIRDERVLAAFRKVPRHRFVNWSERPYAYDDHPLPIGDEQTISQPYIVALMSEALELSEGDKVLEIGTGSGYQTAILAELAREVFTVERIARLQEKAKPVLKDLGYENITFAIGDGYEGYEEGAPYDAILVTAASKKLPEQLLEQLKVGGRLVIPLGGAFMQSLFAIKKREDTYVKKNLGPVRFVPLIH